MSAGRAVGLLLGVAADAAIGDPRRGHPVAGFGKLAHAVEKLVYQDRRTTGIAYTGLLVGSTVTIGILVQRLSRRAPTLEAASTAVVTWAVLGGGSLADEGTEMARILDAGELQRARKQLGNLCGRDASNLDGQELARASVESVAENTSDAVVAPLVWGAVAGVPGLLAYRAANTLDAMVGHRSPRYRDFGWASARFDDLLNLAPARLAAVLTAACAPVLGGSAGGAWRAWRSDSSAHPSPNAGQIEAAFAGALRIRLGGRTTYGYSVEQRPVLGEGRSAAAVDVPRSVELSRLIGAAAGIVSAGAALLFGGRQRRSRTPR